MLSCSWTLHPFQDVLSPCCQARTCRSALPQLVPKEGTEPNLGLWSFTTFSLLHESEQFQRQNSAVFVLSQVYMEICFLHTLPYPSQLPTTVIRGPEVGVVTVRNGEPCNQSYWIRPAPSLGDRDKFTSFHQQDYSLITSLCLLKCPWSREHDLWVDLDHLLKALITAWAQCWLSSPDHTRITCY